ncbi:class I SAM-dependent methyltransferase [Actinoplanes sp. RD1]|uniref:class I SAM-dependent methyltransferase n=1 Tax=Actinoplanes sp. RD1 TaxID=3064538 RepID=UPI002740F4B6|nr:class I SAM-dependent methyltransferase [Actinoplanes sp. RD1]
MSTDAVHGYAYDNDSTQAEAHHRALADLLDRQTQLRLDDLTDLTGKRCLEVGAGGGSIAQWFAERVGPHGSVLATDIKPEHIPRSHVLTPRRHDITSGEPLGRFDVVHARLLLGHLPAREAALRHLIDAVEPGGVLLTEDFLPTPDDDIVAAAPDAETAELVDRYNRLQMRTLESHGADRTWSRRALSAYLDAGLTEVEVTVHGTTWRGGGPGCRLLLAGLGQLREPLEALGMTAGDLDRVAAALQDPRLILNGYLVYLTSGRKPQN